MVVNLNRSIISFDEFSKSLPNRKVNRSELRRTLQSYLEPRLHIHHRSYEEWDWNSSWQHTKQLLIAKTVKDVILRAGFEEWSFETISDHFFVEQSVWLALNSIVLAMQRTVLREPQYGNLVENKKFHEALVDKQAEDFCMVNYKVCRIELKAFYLIKIMHGENGYFNEDLLNFTDFSSYLPLF